MDGEFLALLRKTIGLTQEELAERLGVSRQLITAIEAGNRKVQPYIVTRLFIEFDASYIEEVQRINNQYLKDD